MFWKRESTPVLRGKHFAARVDGVTLSANALSLCSTSAAREVLPYELAIRMRALPLGFTSRGSHTVLQVAADCDNVAERTRELQFSTQRSVEIINVSYGVVLEAIFLAYKGAEPDLVEAAARLPAHSPNVAPNEFTLDPLHGESASVHFLARLIEYSVARGASDIHLIPSPQGSLLKLRIDGDLFSHESPLGGPETHKQLVRRIKVLSKLDLNQTTRPQDGAFRICLLHENYNVRVSSMPTLHGEKVVLRILRRGTFQTIDSLGLSPEVREAMRKAISLDSGLILFIGATGSGKTTSMYAMLQEAMARGLNVCTVEDPIEIELPGASQSQVDLHQGLDYGVSLASILRQDPDVILVGELREIQSATAAVHAALSGHLVLSTIHAGTADECIARLESMGIARSLLNDTVKLVVEQKLLPKLCSCAAFDLKASQRFPFEVRQSVGCTQCGTSGFSGRTALVAASWIDSIGSSHGTPEVVCNPRLSTTRVEGARFLLEQGRITLQQYCDAIEIASP